MLHAQVVVRATNTACIGYGANDDDMAACCACTHYYNTVLSVQCIYCVQKRMTRSFTVRFCRAVPALCRGNIAVEQHHSAVEHASHITLLLQQCIAVVDSVLIATLLLRAKPAYDS
eukprot:5998-Heterococcus_DN1.PRE.2